MFKYVSLCHVSLTFELRSQGVMTSRFLNFVISFFEKIAMIPFVFKKKNNNNNKNSGAGAWRLQLVCGWHQGTPNRCSSPLRAGLWGSSTSRFTYLGCTS